MPKNELRWENLKEYVKEATNKWNNKNKAFVDVIGKFDKPRKGESVPNMIIQLEKACVNVDYFKKEFAMLLLKSSELTEKLKVIYTHHYPDKKI